MSNEQEYRLEFFKERGFIRKQCPRCKTWFWTLNPDQTYCNDAPCVEYTFFKESKAPPLTVTEARRVFIEFFAKHGHKPVEPRPVVARWRDDLYLTIASIVDFQPFVTAGIIPPPANPLVVSQPCIRLEDIDNVGKTAGRHLTSFEMAAHHAFNYPDKYIYWKDETVRYAFEFFTTELKIPPEKITYKESWWEGGGNAGPSFEVTVDGLELATLVFMKYKVEDGSYTEIPLKIVDTGYGVERIAWYSQRTPTAFHAIYRELLDKVMKMLGVESPRENILYTIGQYASRVDPENLESLEEFYKGVSQATGTPIEDVKEILDKLERAFAITDHTRTLALMLADGIVPSNSGEGYLARLVIRRALRSLIILNPDTSLADIIKLQIDYWRNDFPKLKENSEYIIYVTQLEEKRFRELLRRGETIVSRLISKYKGKTAIPLNDLIVIYDSHGIPPDIVKEKAERMGVKVEIPINFYSLVASRHSRAPLKKEEYKIPENITKEIKDLPATKMLFHEDPYIKGFEAKVLRVINGEYLILDKTAFYPEGGGQLADEGYVEVNGNRIRVIDVQKVGDVIIHKLEKPQFSIKEGLKVKGVIDWERRYRLMKHHTATHVILGAARKVLGHHVWQAGAEKSVEKGRLDITHYESLSEDEIERIEREANRIVFQGLDVKTEFMRRDIAEEKYGLILYQGGVPPGSHIRVVEIPGWDVEACFGTHLKNTREIGLIKIINVERIQDGVVRLEYVAGEAALEYLQKLMRELNNIAKKIGASIMTLPSRVESLLEELSEYKKRMSMFKREYMKLLVNNLISSREKVDNINVIVSILDNLGYKDLSDVVKSINEKLKEDNVIILFSKIPNRIIYVVAVSKSLVDKGLTAITIHNNLVKHIKGRGGGKKDYIQGVTRAEPNIDEIKAIISGTIKHK